MMALAAQEALHIRDHLSMFSRRRDIILIFSVTMVLVVAIGSFVMTPIYRATATLLIDVESPNVLTTSGTVALENQNYFSYKEYYQSQIEIVTSDAILKKVFAEFDIGAAPEYASAKEPLRKFAKAVKVEPVRDTRLLKLSVDHKDAEIAARLANRIAEIYVNRNLSYISKNEMLNLLKNEYLKLESRLGEFNKIFREEHPEMIRLKKEIAELVDKIEQEKKSAVTYDVGGEEVKSEYRNALEGLKANNVSILSLADKPVIPIRPKKWLNIILAIVTGLIGGIGIAFFFEYLDDTVKDIGDIEKLVRWPFLGSIPTIDAGGKMKERDKDLFIHIKPMEPIAEAYRAIRTSVLFSATEERPLKSLIVTSSVPQEGKTTTLCNLGIAMAQNGSRVLFVDADMRRLRLHETFDLRNDAGLSTFLCGQAQFDGLVQKTAIDNVSLVSGGPHPPNPSELLASARMVEFVETAKRTFDIIIFDTPPVAILTDAVILSRVVDGVIMVVESGKTSKRMLPRIQQILGDTKTRVVGIVINKIAINSGSYYHSYYYGKSGKV